MKERCNELEWRPYELDEGYFRWLCELVDADHESRSYIFLMRELFETEFSNATANLIPNDDNRIADGLELREEYLEETKQRNHIILCGPCSLLEMIIALSKRMEDIIEKYDYISWFWEMIGNLEFLEFDDDYPVWRSHGYIPEEVYLGINKLLKREYNRNGDGSLFPMNKAKRDMRKTEIWYQMNNYLVENYMDVDK